MAVQKAVAVAFAGALGALARYLIGVTVGRLDFPWATLGINVVGSFLLGYLLGQDSRWGATVEAAIAVGFLGAFTTFSTFSYEAVALVRGGRAGAAATYVAVSVAVGLAASAVGYVLADA